jgi:hypothetical protein
VSQTPQRCALLICHMLLNPRQLTIKIKHHKLKSARVKLNYFSLCPQSLWSNICSLS